MNPRPTRLDHRDHRSRKTATPSAWGQQWASVPALWRSGTYRLDQPPFDQVFVRNTNYLRSTKSYEFITTQTPLLRQEMAWWLYTIWSEGTRKIDPAMLAWWARAISSLATQREAFATGETSVADIEPNRVIREALQQFHARHKRYPSPGNVSNLESCTYSIYSHVTVRCTDTHWWSHPVWDLRMDPRIPRRDHEPHADRAINIGAIDPPWLREGIRYWLSQALILDVYTWTSAAARVTMVGTYFGSYAQINKIQTPIIAGTLPEIREVFMGYLAWLRSPAATPRGKRIAVTGVNAAQSAVQQFYTFMVDNAHAAAQATGDTRWADLTVNHTRLWSPAHASRRAGNHCEPAYLTPRETAALMAHIPVLAAPTDQTITVTFEEHSTEYQGLGDPQAARVWTIQALTGRRASEILMLDRDPITMLSVHETEDPDALVARLRYQQTKVDDVDPTILVDRAVVNLIREQQAWVGEHFAKASDQGRYLFLQPRGNYQGMTPRSYRSYSDALKRLDKTVALLDDSQRALRFTQTHRLRHTRATELLNNGVPVHVVQRYLGHKSPEMTMRYAATLAATEEAEFLRYKKVGADGRDLGIAPRDLLDLAQLDQRADRVLPNGLCLLPPTQACDKGNACLPCGSFATDQTHLPEHRAQRERLQALITTRQQQYQARHGSPMPETNIWLTGRLRELSSLEAIIRRLEGDLSGECVRGAGAAGRTDLILITDAGTRADLHQQLKTRSAQ